MMSVVRTNRCPGGGWVPFFRFNVCYKFFKGQRTYDSAKRLCKEQGGEQAELAIASDIGRNNKITYSFTDEIVWLGGGKRWVDLPGGGLGQTWTWDDGTQMSYTNWIPNEPSRRR